MDDDEGLMKSMRSSWISKKESSIVNRQCSVGESMVHIVSSR
jgi:hypothetical protein